MSAAVVEKGTRKTRRPASRPGGRKRGGDPAKPLVSGGCPPESLRPESFGAKGDGQADDTAAIQRALDAAASGASVVLGNRVYAVRSLTIGPGLGGLTGCGTLRGLDTEPVVIVRGATAAGGGPAVGVQIRGIAIDAGSSACAIQVTDARGTAIEGCRVAGLRDVSRGISIGHGCERTVVRNCRIEAPRGAHLQSLVCIAIESPLSEGPPGYFSPGGYFNPPAGRAKYIEETTCDTVIEGNTIDGGTHGMGIAGACRTRVVNNTIAHNSHRNINICPASRHNVILGNSLIEAGSSAVAMAYGSSFNLVAHNAIASRSTGPGYDRDAIHAYVGCGHNLIGGNQISGDFRYGVYLAVNACGNVVQGNVIRLSAKPDLPGDFTVGVGLENEWPERPLPEGAAYSRQNFGSSPTGAWAYEESSGNVIQGNLVEGCTCGFYVAQIGAALAVRRNRWDDNTAIGCECAFYAFGGAAEKLRDNILSGLVIEGCRQGVLLPPWPESPFAAEPR